MNTGLVGIFVCLASALLGSGFPASAAPRRSPAAPKSAAVHSVPGFTLPDLSGKPHRLTEFRGKPVALFFFCGCDACHRCAKTWADVQSSGVLPGTPTVIVFSGESRAAQSFLADTGLDPAQTTMLTDPKDTVAEAYHAPVCPRVFAMDRHAGLRYTNNEHGTDPQTMPTAVLVSRAITALQAATLPPKVSIRKNTTHHASQLPIH